MNNDSLTGLKSQGVPEHASTATPRIPDPGSFEFSSKPPSKLRVFLYRLEHVYEAYIKPLLKWVEVVEGGQKLLHLVKQIIFHIRF
jgi:hypothetical protein